jgi:hypothetical protein
MSLKSWWPGVSRQLKASPSGSKLITAELTDIPVLALAAGPRAPDLTGQLDRPGLRHCDRAQNGGLQLHPKAQGRFFDDDRDSLLRNVTFVLCVF